MTRISLSSVLALSLALILASCTGMSPGGGSAVSPPDALAQVQAGAAYLDATLAKIQTAVATAKAQSPDKAATIETRVEPTVATLQQLVTAFDTAVATTDATTADSQWGTARDAVSAALGAGIQVLGPKVLLGLLGG